MAAMHPTSEFLLEQCVRYPELRPQDLLKALRQSAFGCGHLPVAKAARTQPPREETGASLFVPTGPAYCVVRREYVRLLPLLAKIDRLLSEKSRIIVALEGGSAAGKSTAAALLEKLYDCGVFHMDDFFLRPEQRTRARLTEPGGNVDWERFQEEVLSPLTRGETIRYRRYNCHTQTVEAPESIVPRALNLVEGVYCMRPELGISLRVS